MKDLINIDKAIANTVAKIAETADDYPGIVIIHNVKENFNKTEYMSPRGLKLLGVTMAELTAMGGKYFPRYFNMEDAKGYVPIMLDMVKRNKLNDVYSFFQQVRYSREGAWNWYSSSIKLILQDNAGDPLLSITFAIPMNTVHYLTNKVSRMLEENNFIKANFKQFSRLTKRELEILKLFALGKSSTQISETIHISSETVKTHRKNIYKKLNITSSFNLSEYARAFDLI
jgi:DNA-binding CsgD family transcriptional regulator